jgi:hypothetical protein
MTDSIDAIGRMKYHCPACAARAAAVAPALVQRVRELEAQLAQAAAGPATAQSEVPLEPGRRYHTCRRCTTIAAPKKQYCAACKPDPTASWKGRARVCTRCEVSFQPKRAKQSVCSACSRRGLHSNGHPCRGCGATLRTVAWLCPVCKAAKARPPRKSLSSLVRQSLQRGPSNATVIQQFAHTNGVPATPSQIYQALYALQRQGAVQRTVRAARSAGWTSSTFALVGAPTP